MSNIRHTGGLERLRVTLESLAKAQVKVGFFPQSKYPDGTPVAYAATIQEFGSPVGKIPPRPFMRPTVDARQKEWSATVARATRQALQDGEGVDVVEALGLIASGDIAHTIKTITTPALSPVTVLLRQWRRGGIKVTRKTVAIAATLIEKGVATVPGGTAAKPLVDSGVMFNAVSYEVEQ